MYDKHPKALHSDTVCFVLTQKTFKVQEIPRCLKGNNLSMESLKYETNSILYFSRRLYFLEKPTQTKNGVPFGLLIIFSCLVRKTNDEAQPCKLNQDDEFPALGWGEWWDSPSQLS